MPETLPDMSTLAGAAGSTFTLGRFNPRLGLDFQDCVQCGLPATFSAGPAGTGPVSPGFSADPAEGGAGIWVPWVPDRAVYALATAGTQWMGTGPFTGCYIVFFAMGGRVGMAHIATPSRVAMPAWDAFRRTNDVLVLNQWMVPTPDPGRSSATYLFLDLAKPRVGLVQVDVLTVSNLSSGPVFNVKRLV